MVRHTYTYTRPDTTVKWWEDDARDIGMQEITELYDYHMEFFNNIVDTQAGESWSITDVDDYTKVFSLICSQERLAYIVDRFAQDNKCVSLRYLNDDYNNRHGITSTVATVEV